MEITRSRFLKRKKKRRIIVRIAQHNRISFPVLLNAWEQHGIDKEFEIIVRPHPLSPHETQPHDVVLYSFMSLFLPLIHEEISLLKETNKPIIIAGGGSHITGEQELAPLIGFDTLFIGAGENSFLEFGEDLLDNRPIPAQYVQNCNRSPNDEFNRHLPVSQYMKTLPPLEIMRGCRWNCKYCSTSTQEVCCRDISSIDAYLDKMKKRGIPRVNFISPSSMEYGSTRPGKVNLEKIGELLERTCSYGFRFVEYGIFPSEVRPNTITPGVTALLKKYVSNKYLTVGAQSGLNSRLKELRRGHSVEDIEQAAAIANDGGFSVHLDFIVGYPDETPEERRVTVKFIRELNRKYRARSHLHHFIPLSGSAYAFRLPSFLSEPEKEELYKLRTAGIATDGWISNELQARQYIGWLKTTFPDYYSRFS
jgi:B12-binding domain/radical SAM domain protein